MQLIVLGDSHAVALGAGLAAIKGRGEDTGFPGEVRILKIFSSPTVLKPFFDVKDGAIRIMGRENRERVAVLLDEEPIRPRADRIFAFSMGFTNTRLLRSDMWRSHRVWIASSRAGAHLLSMGMVRAIAAHHHRHVLNFAAATRAVGLNACFVSAPPPRSDDKEILQVMSPQEAGLIDHLAREAVEKRLDALCIPWVTPPAEAFDPAGGGRFLDKAFFSERASDRHHANAAYGEHMLRDIVGQAIKMTPANADPETA